MHDILGPPHISKSQVTACVHSALTLFAMFTRSVAAVVCLAAIACASRLDAQSQPVPTPLSFDAARAWADANNAAIDAVRRGLAIREADVRAAGQRPNPSLGAEVSRDSPHQTISLDLPFDLSGQRRRRIAVAQGELAVADVDVQASRRQVRRQVREQFFALLAADEQLRLAESIREIAIRVRDAAQGRFDAGAVPRLEVMQADLGVARAEADLDAARSSRAAAQALLDGVLNLPPQQPLTLQGTLRDHTAAPAYDAALASAFTSNTDLLSLDRQLDVEARRLQLLRAERTPAPVFSVAGLFHSPGDFTAAPSAAVNIELPLFSRNQGEMAASIATTAQLRGQREATRRSLDTAIFAASARVESARRQVDTFTQRLLPVATELQALSEESYQAGRTSVLGLLDAQRSLRDLSRDAVQAALDLHLALAELEDLLGTPLP